MIRQQSMRHCAEGGENAKTLYYQIFLKCKKGVACIIYVFKARLAHLYRTMPAGLIRLGCRFPRTIGDVTH